MKSALRICASESEFFRVCVFVCWCGCKPGRVCLCVCMPVLCVCMPVLCVCMWSSVYTLIARKHPLGGAFLRSAHTRTHTHARTYVHIYMHECMYVFTYICTCICICKCICICIYISYVYV